MVVDRTAPAPVPAVPPVPVKTALGGLRVRIEEAADPGGVLWEEAEATGVGVVLVMPRRELAVGTEGEEYGLLVRVLVSFATWRGSVLGSFLWSSL